MPLARSEETRPELNCVHTPLPSPALIISVLIPYRRAVAMIEDRLPPLDCDTYQTHIPRPVSARAAPAARGGGAGAPTVDPAEAPPEDAVATAAEEMHAQAAIAARTRRSLSTIT